MKSENKISIIIITRDRPEELSLAIKDLYQQDFANKEIIVIDNASQNPSLKQLKKSFPNIKTYYLDKNLGVGAGRNYGIERSTGNILIFIDDDSRVEDQKLVRKIDQYFKDDKKLKLLCFKIIDEKSRRVLRQTIPRRDKKDKDHSYLCSYFMGGGFAIKKEVFDKVGLFDENYFYSGEELDLSFRMSKYRMKMVYNPNLQIIHKNSPFGRYPGQRYFYLIRNRIWIAIKFLPWRYVFSHVSFWLIYMSFESILMMHFLYYVKGVISSITKMPSILKSRKPLTKKEIKYLNRLSGRTYF